MRKLKERLDHIDALLNRRPAHVQQLLHDRIINYAEQGVAAPETLTGHEIRQVCFALIAHYSLQKIT